MNSSRDDIAAQLSAIDRQLIQLLLHRVELLLSMPVTKLPSNNELFKLGELERLIEKEQFHSTSTIEQVQQWLKHGISLSNCLAHPEESIVYLGPIYSQRLAAVKYFGLGAESCAQNTISSAWKMSAESRRLMLWFQWRTTQMVALSTRWVCSQNHRFKF
ncbi:MAG: hypothetical protein U0930_25355 [Pirellulales bacterium]